MMDGINKINDNLNSFTRKYYLSLALRGALLTLSLLLFYFLIASVVEYNLWLSGKARLLIFSSFFLLVVFCLYLFLKQPIAWWLYKKGLGQEESARIIGDRFPAIRDRLVNLVQLRMMQNDSSLLQAGIVQKAGQFDHIQFDSAIDLSENRRYLKYFLVPFLLIISILIFNRAILTQSSHRLVSFNQEFSPTAPFNFVVVNKSLVAFYNEDFTLHVKLDGDALPDALYLNTNGQRLKLESTKAGEFEFTFEKVQHEIPFQLEASGFFSTASTISMVNRPELTRLKMLLEYPRYLGRRNEELTNSGNAEVPEGTNITWEIRTAHATKASAGFSSDSVIIPMQNPDNEFFKFSRAIKKADQYWIDLDNGDSKNKDRISYALDVIKDQYPEIEVEHVKDSVLYKNVFLGGALGDDYGITALALNYEIINNGKPTTGHINLPITKGLLQQTFYYAWRVDSLHLEPGDKLNYFLQVWDNDGVNGHKSTKSPVFVFAVPGEEELKSEISKSQSSAQSQMDKSLKKAQDLQENIEDIQQKLKGKQVLDWQDKKMIQDLVEKKKGLDQLINDLQKQNQQLDQKKDAFSEQNEKIKEKAEQIQKLMEDLLDPETKKLFEDLEKLLKENSDINQMQKLLDKMNRKELNLEKELDRTLQLFKQMQLDYKVDQAISDLKKELANQEALLKETEKQAASEKDKPGEEKSDKDQQNDDKPAKDSKAEADQKGKQDENKADSKKQNPDNQSLEDKQKKIQEDFTKTMQDLNEIKKLAEDMQKDVETPSEEKQKDVQDAQEESKESLSKKQAKKSTAPQKKAIQKMNEMQQQMEGMQSDMEMEIDMQNLESLRQILHGLIKLSYDQENLMKDFNQIQQTDPKYIQLSQNQLKVKDDSKVLEDSLIALSKKDPFLSSIVTKEIGELNGHLDKSAENVRERRKPNASSEMQLSMTSINNLALMLNDHFEAMMDMMKNAMPGKKKGKKPSQGQSLSELQKSLNQKIEELKNGGKKSGRQYSEELARVAAEQERIRRALQQMQEKLKQEGGKLPGNDLPGKMEQTEMDLVNKQITEQTIKRQKEIETRLLETEKAMREQEMDQERKGESARDYDKEIPAGFEEYLRLKEKEVELLKSVPPKFYPYYKKEVNDYFKRIRNQN